MLNTCMNIRTCPGSSERHSSWWLTGADVHEHILYCGPFTVQVLVGLVLRDHLMVLLRRGLAAGGTAAIAAGPVPYEELSRHVVTAAARSYVSEQQMAVLQVRTQLRPSPWP